MHLATKLAAALLVTICATAPVYAFAADPTGTWQTTTGESRYKVSYCGDGTELCAKLVWLRKDARTQENLPYLNHYVVKGAALAADNKWKGEVSYAGDTFAGTLTMTGANSLKLNGCQGVFCKTMNFSRI
ncbi:MAG: hypothetical protein JWQ89_2813 [Devosia sp.]|uniref:DUF2147 domain-containing protein n=1 Tax=Devosia sp. TaxID=1871048 RepID=UPI00260FD839|nr:DUF2147 domain-containing protein [Devosia sp.]MDB5541086.1 hypothetical protein [Devosia sp.]